MSTEAILRPTTDLIEHHNSNNNKQFLPSRLPVPIKKSQPLPGDVYLKSVDSFQKNWRYKQRYNVTFKKAPLYRSKTCDFGATFKLSCPKNNAANYVQLPTMKKFEARPRPTSNVVPPKAPPHKTLVRSISAKPPAKRVSKSKLQSQLSVRENEKSSTLCRSTEVLSHDRLMSRISEHTDTNHQSSTLEKTKKSSKNNNNPTVKNNNNNTAKKKSENKTKPKKERPKDLPLQHSFSIGLFSKSQGSTPINHFHRSFSEIETKPAKSKLPRWSGLYTQNFKKSSSLPSRTTELNNNFLAGGSKSAAQSPCWEEKKRRSKFFSGFSSPSASPRKPSLRMSLERRMTLSQEIDKDALTGYLYVNILNGKGFNKNYDTYIVLELDSYGHFFKKSKTKPVKGTEPTWEEAFEHEIEVCTELRLTCYSKFRLKDDVCGKCTINLTRESLLDNKNHSLNVSLDRGQANLNVSLCFATSAEQIEKAKARRETGVFGAPINVVCSREKSVLPALVVSCIKEIEKRGMDEVGIYRLSGVASEIQNLKKLFNEDTQNAVVALHETDIHAVAGLLKLYFRELPECLFTGKLYTKFVEGLKISEAEEKELYMLDVLHELPRVNKLTALYLFEHLRRVAVREEQNKMGINNLATVFGPTCLRTPPPSSQGSGGQHSISCTVGTFDIGALDVMSQVRIFLFFLALSNSPRSCLPQDDLELWRRLDMDRALELEEVMMEKAEEHLI